MGCGASDAPAFKLTEGAVQVKRGEGPEGQSVDLCFINNLESLAASNVLMKRETEGRAETLLGKEGLCKAPLCVLAYLLTISIPLSIDFKNRLSYDRPLIGK
jgi:hypothetical protein